MDKTSHKGHLTAKSMPLYVRRHTLARERAASCFACWGMMRKNRACSPKCVSAPTNPHGWRKLVAHA